MFPRALATDPQCAGESARVGAERALRVSESGVLSDATLRQEVETMLASGEEVRTATNPAMNRRTCGTWNIT
jgi:hypothetical protein